MKNIFFLISLFFIMTNAFAQSYPSATGNVQVPNNIEWLKHTQKIISGSAIDPKTASVNAGASSILMKTDGNIYVKKDAGNTINWKKFLDEASNLEQLNNVSGTALNGSILAYSTGTSKWAPIPLMEFGTVDPFGRTQIWNHSANASLRLGSLRQDGDPGDSSSEGSVFYGPDIINSVMDSDIVGDFGYARVKSNRFGLYNSTANSAGYYYRVDPTSMYFTNNTYSKTFEVDRVTGNIKAGTVAIKETTTPSTLLNYGKIYPKADKLLYYVDSAGLEQKIVLGVGGKNLVETSPIVITQDTTTATFSIPVATTATSGYLSNADWNTFNGKEDVIVFNAPLSRTASNVSILKSQPYQNGYLSSTDYKTFQKKVTSDMEAEVSYPSPIEYNGTVRSVNDEATLLAEIAASSSGDIINLTASITLTSTLVINKSVKIDGAFALKSAGAGTDPVILVSVTSPNVYITNNVTISHLKTSNTSVESAIAVANTATNFVSNATVNYMEFAYTLRGNFSVGGRINYTGALANNNRATVIYQVNAPSQINGVVYDFPSEATPRFRFILLSSTLGTDKFDYNLKVANCYPLDKTKIMSQFYISDALIKTVGALPSLIFDNNYINHRNGAIGIYEGSGISPLSFFDYIAVLNNYETNTASTLDQFKGLFYFDGVGVLRDLGTTRFYYSGNRHPYTLQSTNLFTSSYDYAGVGYANTVFTNVVPFAPIDGTSVADSAFSYSRNLPTKAQIDNLNLDALTDVVIITPTASQTLTYNGTSWVNTATALSGKTLVGTSPVVITQDATTATFSIPLATTATDGYLSSANWTTFNSKENALTFNGPLTRLADAISIPLATTATDGYLASTDWTIFNDKLTPPAACGISQHLAYNGTTYICVDAYVSAGQASNYFFIDTPSGISTYFTLSKTASTGAEELDTISMVASNVETLYGGYADGAIGSTSIEAGFWEFNLFRAVTTGGTGGTTEIRIKVFKRSTTATETQLFEVTTGDINDTAITLQSIRTVQPAFSVAADDILLVKIYAITTAQPKTVTFTHNGTARNSFIASPIIVRHNQLAGLQGGTTNEYYHLTAAQVSATWTASGTDIYRATGNVGIGNTNPITTLHVTGDSTITGYNYFGGLPTVDGTFRMYVSGGALITEKRISGVWVEVSRLDEN